MKLASLVNATVESLNEMSGAACCSRPGVISEGQLSALCNLWEAHLAAKPAEPAPTAREAFVLLRGTSSPSTYGLPTNLASYRKGSVALPESAAEAVPLLDILPPADRLAMANFEDHMMLTESEVSSINQELGEITPYCDPVLRSDWRQYACFLRRLERAGVVRWALARKERCTPFFVKKKNDDLRLIIDARRFNRRCKPPPYSPMGSVPSLLGVEVPADETLYFAASDIKDCFHHFKLPAALQEYFGLDGLPAKLLGIRRLDGQPVAPETTIYPLIMTAPMGCSWSMYWCQRAHEHCVNLCATSFGLPGLSAAQRLQERRPFGGWPEKQSDAPFSDESTAANSSLNLVYADNNAVLGLCAAEVEKLSHKLHESLSSLGLPLHEKTGVVTQGEFLGVSIDGVSGRVAPSAKRIWRVRMAFDYLSREPRVTGDEVLKLIGHATYLFLFNRGLLSTLRHLYDFAAKAKERRVKLWASAARECVWVRDLVVLAAGNLRRTWSSSVYCSDASEDGFGVVAASWEPERIRRLGRWRERWRYKDEAASAAGPRALALALDEKEIDVSDNTSFPEVSGRQIRGHS